MSGLFPDGLQQQPHLGRADRRVETVDLEMGLACAFAAFNHGYAGRLRAPCAALFIGSELDVMDCPTALWVRKLTFEAKQGTDIRSHSGAAPNL